MIVSLSNVNNRRLAIGYLYNRALQGRQAKISFFKSKFWNLLGLFDKNP